MNDFTKEELEQLLFDMDAKIFEIGEDFIHEFSLKLRDKIQSLINSYCEHEMLDSASNPMCIKCGVYP